MIVVHGRQENKFSVSIFFQTQSKHTQNDRNFPVQQEKKNGNKPVRSADTVHGVTVHNPLLFAIYYWSPFDLSRVFVRSKSR